MSADGSQISEGSPPASAWDYGPRVTFSVDRATHARLTAEARRRGVSLSALVRKLVIHRADALPEPESLGAMSNPIVCGPTPRGLLREACAAAGMTVDEARGPGRTRETSERRWHVMAILSDAGWSSVKIGRALGDRDHTTVLHGLGRWRELNAERAA